MSNKISRTLGTEPGDWRNVVWVPNPNHLEYDPAIPKVIEWCAKQGLDASRMPHPDGVVICLDSPDGGLVAYVTEFAEVSPIKHVNGTPVRLPVRRVEVDSVPPAGGIVPEWAAYIVREAAV